MYSCLPLVGPKLAIKYSSSSSSIIWPLHLLLITAICQKKIHIILTYKTVKYKYMAVHMYYTFSDLSIPPLETKVVNNPEIR